MLKRYFCLGFMIAALANGQEAPLKKNFGEKITVTDRKTSRNLLKTPAAESSSLEIATSTVDQDDIQRQTPSTLTELLDFAPGIHTENRGRKYKSFTSFRGQVYPYPTYAVNGLWQREFSELSYVLPASQIENVRIVRSSGTLLMGLADITGAIDILPRRYDQKTTLLEAEIGTLGTYRGALSQGNSFSNGWYTIGASVFGTEGPKGRNAAEQAQSVYGQGGLRLNDRLDLEGQFFALAGARELMTPDPNGPALKSLKSRKEEYDPFNAFFAGAKVRFEQTPKATIELSGSYSERNYHYTRTLFKPTQADENDYEYTLQAIQALKLNKNNTIRFGGVYNRWVSPEGKRSYTGQKQDVETWAVVILDEHQFDPWTLDAGVRIMRDYYHEYSGTTFDVQGNSRNFDGIQNQWGDPLLTLTFGTKYEASNNTTFYIHIAGGERSVDPGALSASRKALSNESRLMLDAGVKWQDKDKGMIKFGGFYTLRKDAINKTSQLATNSLTGNEFYLSDNQDIRQYGLELESRSTPICGIATLLLNATLMESKHRGADSNKYTDFIEIPNLILSAGIYADFDRWDMNLFGKYVSGYENNRFAQDKRYYLLGDYSDLNATISYTLGQNRSTRIYLKASNLLDDNYSTVVGWSNPGREWQIGVQHQF